jgi:hypothetical protein
MFKDIKAIEIVHQCMYIFAVRYTVYNMYVLRHMKNLFNLSPSIGGEGGGSIKTLECQTP